MIRGIIFDCFGVLYVNVTEAYFSQFPEHYKELQDLDKQSDRGIINRNEYIERVSALTKKNVAEIELAFAREHVLNKDLVNYIKKELKPRYKIGLVSNIGRGWIQDFFDEHQLHGLFDTNVLSGEVGILKPDPRIFELAALRLGVDTEECIMIDDREENCYGAREAGMKSILFTSTPHLIRELTVLLKENP